MSFFDCMCKITNLYSYMQWIFNNDHNSASWGTFVKMNMILHLREESQLVWWGGGVACKMLEYKHYTLIILYS